MKRSSVRCDELALAMMTSVRRAGVTPQNQSSHCGLQRPNPTGESVETLPSGRLLAGFRQRTDGSLSCLRERASACSRIRRSTRKARAHSLGISAQKLKCVAVLRLAHRAPIKTSAYSKHDSRVGERLLELAIAALACSAKSRSWCRVLRTVSRRVTAARIVRQRRGWSGTDQSGCALQHNGRRTLAPRLFTPLLVSPE